VGIVGRFAIDGIAIKTPSKFTVGIQDISSEETGRTLDGVMHKDVVLVAATMQCSWNLLDWEEAATILNAVDGKTSLMLAYPDPRYPNRSTVKKCYVGDRTAPAYTLVDGQERWQGVAFNFIEIGEE
jgi:hypothetical protein